MRRVDEIIRDAGGARAIHEASEGDITRDAVYKWPSIGIPDRHWPILIKLARSTPDELFQANLIARNPEEAATNGACQ